MPTGTQKTYDFTNGVKLNIEDMVYLLQPSDVPLLGTFNGTENVPPGPQRSALSQEICYEKKVEWLEDDLLIPRTTLAATAVTADTAITVASGERTRFSTGDIVRIGSEVLRITGYGSTTDTLTVSRAFGGTAAQQSNASVVVGVGTALSEGSDPENARSTDRTTVTNVTEIFGPYKVTVSGTQEAIAKYGVTSEFDYQLAKQNRQLWVAIEQAIIYGVLVAGSSGTPQRAMGGIASFITTNVDSTTTDITEAKLLDQMQNSYDNGGIIDTLLLGPAQKRKISALKTNYTLNLNRSDRIRGQVVDQFEGDFGTADVLLDRFVRSSDMYLLDKQYITVCTLAGREASFTPLAKTGDTINGMILTEKTLKVRMQKRHAKFNALT